MWYCSPLSDLRVQYIRPLIFMQTNHNKPVEGSEVCFKNYLALLSSLVRFGLINVIIKRKENAIPLLSSFHSRTD
jgi:hypothetical protein